MSLEIVITVLVLTLLAVAAGAVYLVDHKRKTKTIGEELVIRVVEEQLVKEKERPDIAPFDKQQRRRACMQRFERYARDHQLALPIDLAARIHAQLSVKGK